MDAQHPAPRIGLWGTFDLEELDEVLFPRIARRELGRRLPGATVRTFAPFGPERGNRLDGGEPAEGLGSYGPERVAELSRELDLVVVGPVDLAGDGDLAARYGVDRDEVARRAPGRFFVEGLGPELEAEVPVAWSAVAVPVDPSPQEAARYRDALPGRRVLSVRDEASRRRLEAAGVRVAVVPDPAVLASRLFTEDLLERRLEHLRALGWFPSAGLPLVVQGDRSLLPLVEDLAASVASVAEHLGGVPVVLVEVAGGDGGFAAAMGQALPGPTQHAAGAGVEDVMAAIRTSAGLVCSSPRAGASAFAFGRPHVVLAPGPRSAAEGFARLIDAPESVVRGPGEVAAAFEKVASLGPRPQVVRRVQIAVDEHLDAVARMAADAARGRAPLRAPVASDRGARGRLEALQAAYEARGRLLATQRWTFADRVRDAEARERATRRRLEAETARLSAEVARLEAEVAGKDRELHTLLGTRTFRYTAGLRRAWGALRRLFRR
ncbi:MAG: hypothetical protein ACRDI0_07880 [Actinomycetota bacterium]